MGSSENEIAESEGVLRGHLGVLGFQEILSERLEAAAREHGQYSYVLLELQGPKSPAEETTYDVASLKDVDAVLEVGVSECGLLQSGVNIFNPDLQFFIRLEARLFTAERGQLSIGPFYYFSRYQKRLAQWSADDARLLREELDFGLQSLASEIVERVHSLRASGGH